MFEVNDLNKFLFSIFKRVLTYVDLSVKVFLLIIVLSCRSLCVTFF